MKHFIAVVVLLSSAICTFAQTEAREAGFVGKLGHYIGTHKETVGKRSCCIWGLEC